MNERAISTTIVVNRQRIKLMSVYFPHSGYADHHIEKMYKTITENYKRYIPIIGGDFNAELGPGHGNECISVGRYTLNEGNKNRRLDETLADVTRLHNTQYDVQENTSETNDLRFSKKKIKLTTFWPREDTWDTIVTPRPTTWSTWEVATDVSWLLSRSACLERTSNTRI